MTDLAQRIAQCAHIPDEEVARDLLDTEREIEQYRRLQAAEEEIARSHPSAAERKMADFKARARPHQIAERQKLVDFLRALQAARAFGDSR